MDEVVEAVEKAKKEWEETYSKAQQHMKAIQDYDAASSSSVSLPRLNGLAQDCLALLQSLQFQIDLLAPQLPTDDQIKSALQLLDSWKQIFHDLRGSLRNANLQAKANMRKAAQLERELLLGGGEESTIRRRNLQTKAGMTSAAESITESLRRTRQLMVQEVERSTGTLMTFEESTTVLRKAETEYKGHRSLLSRTRNLLSTMQRQDVLDRVILVVGVFLFSCAVLYVVSKRIGILAVQRKVTAALKAGMAGKGAIKARAVEDAIPRAIKEAIPRAVKEAIPRAVKEAIPRAVDDGINVAQVMDNAVPMVEVPVEQAIHDEL
ncbi:BNIP1-RELATED [Salix purpurea]|uniref:BNIP1-RELATED n=1 Tax=Salix purpurea TaxID=77065 RepID=A0A9Q0TWZ5_SALPP|nr:BNIP1-RELATED [Salix purpurea]